MSPSESSKGIDTRENGSETEIALPKSRLYPDGSDATLAMEADLDGVGEGLRGH